MKYTEMLDICKNINSSNAGKKVVVVGDYFLDKWNAMTYCTTIHTTHSKSSIIFLIKE